MYAAVKFLVALATWLGLILAITGHAVADERNTRLVAVVLVIEGQERVMNPPSVVWTLSGHTGGRADGSASSGGGSVQCGTGGKLGSKAASGTARGAGGPGSGVCGDRGEGK